MDPNSTVGRPLSEQEADKEARRIMHTEFGAVPATFPTSYRDPSSLPAYGGTPPVPQPGRPPMSQGATDASGLMLAAGVASVPIGGITSLTLYVIGQGDPTNYAVVGGCSIAFVLAVGSLLRRLSGVRTENHHHYNGTVTQDHRRYTSQTRGVIARTRNHHGR